MRPYYLILLLALSGCAAKHVTVREPEIVKEAPAWVVVRVTTPDPSCPTLKCEHLRIWASSTKAAIEASKEVCGKSYVCVGPEPNGVVMDLERRRR